MVFATFFWATNLIAGKLMNGYIPPITLCCLRWTIAIIILFPFVIKKLIFNIKIIKQNWLLLLILGLTGIALNPTLTYVGLTYTTAMNCALINTISPLFIILAALIFLKESISTKKTIGLIFSLCGVVFIISHGNLFKILQLSFNIGDLIIILAIIIWALYSTALRFMPNNFDPLLLLFTTSIFAEIFLIPAALIEYHFGTTPVISPLSASVLIYLAIFPAILAFVAWNIGLKTIGNTTCGILSYLITLFSSILAIFFLKENLHIFHIVSFSLIIIGSLLTLEKKQSKTITDQTLPAFTK